MNLRLICVNALTLCLIFISPFAVNAQITYPSSCIKLNDALMKAQEVNAKTSNEQVFDYRERVKYIIENYSDLQETINELSVNTSQFESRFEDDVKVVATVSFFALSYPGTDAIAEFEKRAAKIIESDLHIQIEAETYHCFSDIVAFSFFFDEVMWTGNKVITDMVRQKNIRGLLIFGLINVALFDDMDIDKVEGILNQYAKILDQEQSNYLHEMLELAKKSQ